MSTFNLTDTFDKEYLVDGHVLDENWLRWSEKIPELYIDGINKVMQNLNTIKEKPTNFILENYSHAAYAKYVEGVINE